MKSDVYNFLGLHTFMKKAIFVLGMLILSLTSTSYAQDVYNFSGVVNDETGQPLPGVNVIEKGTANGTISDIDGTFKLKSTKSEIIVSFSMVGYLSIDETLVSGTTATVVMKENVETLGEVLVVGYGTQKKSNITGSIAKMGSKELEELPTTTVNEAIQGRVAGVNVTSTSGAPGATQKVVIRGVATNGNTQPLYVVDGMATSNIDNIEPSDVESISVLKDAASAAIYGAEAANGVVIITTKSGNIGSGRIEYNMQMGMQSVGDYTQPMDAASYATWVNEANVGVEIPTNSTTNTQWMNEILNNAFMQRHNLSFSGGTEKGTYYISGAYMNQDGVIGKDKSNYERFNLRTNVTQHVKPWVKVGANVSYTHSKRSSITEDDEFGGIVSSAAMLDPLTPTIYSGALPEYAQAALDAGNTLLQNEDGAYYGVSEYVKGEIANPLAQIALAKGNTKNDHFMGNVYLTLGDESWKGFKFTTRASADVNNQLYHTWNPTYWFSSERMNTQTSTRDNTDTWFTWMWENYISYDKTFANNHNLSVVAGISAKQHTHKYLTTLSGPMFAEGDDFAQHGDVEIDGKLSGNLLDTRTNSYFARASYDFKGKYLLQAVFRRDGTSLLGTDNRWGNFPSVSAGWIVSQEDFWNVSAIDFFKIRASWGTNGNLSSLDPDQFRSLIVSSGFQYPMPGGGYYTGAEPELLANPELVWASSEQLDIGFDMALFGDKLTFGLDYFNKKTKDLLVPGTPPPSVGNYAPFVNAGDVTNKGVEIELGYRNYENNFKYDVSANMTFLDNEVTYLNPLLDRVSGAGVGTGWTASYLELNQPVWFFRGYKTDGIFQNEAQIAAYKEANGGLAGYDPVPGDPIVVNTNGDNLINDEDQTNIGNPHPKFIWGTYFNFSYSGFDLKMFIQGVHGQDVLMGWNRYDRSTSNRPQFFFDERWTGEGSTNERPRAEQSSPYIYNSDLMVFKGSYVKIRQIQLGYTVPKKLFKDNINRLRLYVSLDDYFTFTNYPGMDPVAGSDDDNSLGIDRGYYPTPRKVLFGLSFSF